MDQNGIAQRVAAGLGQAASRLGSAYVQYRPVDPHAPLAGPPIASLDCVFDPSPAMTLVATDLRRSVFATVVCDFSTLALGDYLVGPETWFVSGMEAMRAPTCTRCNATVSILLPVPSAVTGDESYGGRRGGATGAAASGWPASLLSKPRNETDAAHLPGDVRSAIVEILLPPLAGVPLSYDVVVVDDGGDSYLVSAVERTAAGWRLGAGLITT